MNYTRLTYTLEAQTALSLIRLSIGSVQQLPPGKKVEGRPSQISRRVTSDEEAWVSPRWASIGSTRLYFYVVVGAP